MYRGENEYSLPWNKGTISWTTSMEVAEKFARGVRLRMQGAAQPKIIVGKVHKKDILARINDRDEFTLICKDVSFVKEIKLKGAGLERKGKARIPSQVIMEMQAKVSDDSPIPLDE